MEKCKTDSIEPEVCCGHPITTKTKKIWRTELDLAEQLRRICEKHDITYYAIGGTLLGAVRHQGFIPWDDDMDFGMTYSEFRKFCEVAASELEYPYAFETNFTMARIRRSDTTGCTKYELDHAVPTSNLGIFIDIFPMFVIPDSKLKRKLHYRVLRALRISNRRKDALLKKKAEGTLQAVNYIDPRVLVWKSVEAVSGDLTKTYMDLCAMFEQTEGKDYCLTSFMSYKEMAIWPRWMFAGKRIWLPFESIKVPAPEHYDERLTKEYGDYRVFVKGAAQHSIPICDPDVPYREKLKNRINFTTENG